MNSQQFRHTPKPWHLEPHDEFDKHICVRGGRQYIAGVSIDDIDLKEGEANANLMVASPDLLAFAQWAESRQPEMLKMIEANKFVFTDIGNEPGKWQHLAFTLYTELCALNEMAQSVIAKATKGTL